MVCFETFFTCCLSQAKRLVSLVLLVSSLVVVVSSSGLERLRFGAIVFVARVSANDQILVKRLG